MVLTLGDKESSATMHKESFQLADKAHGKTHYWLKLLPNNLLPWISHPGQVILNEIFCL
jgi:hypothetical protein